MTNTTCGDCGIAAPPADNDSTLISVKYGWRLTREPQPNGETVFHWRCPDCWRRQKERLGTASSGQSGIVSKILAAALRRKA